MSVMHDSEPHIAAMSQPKRVTGRSIQVVVRLPIEIHDRLKLRGERLSPQIVDAVRVYLDVLDHMPAKSPTKLAGEHQAPKHVNLPP